MTNSGCHISVPADTSCSRRSVWFANKVCVYVCVCAHAHERQRKREREKEPGVYIHVYTHTRTHTHTFIDLWKHTRAHTHRHTAVLILAVLLYMGLRCQLLPPAHKLCATSHTALLYSNRISIAALHHRSPKHLTVFTKPQVFMDTRILKFLWFYPTGPG